ncbi:VOC family protein [Streptosporangium saharense]|uniref:VOC family protein n=1 Tax=Streptosporangium saharense TaxID=1706840 RepID=UPI003323DE4C
MDALHPRLLVGDFPATFRFYRALLGKVTGATLARGGENGPYASWDLDGRTLLALYGRAAMAADLGAPVPDGRGSRDATVLVLRVSAAEGALEAAVESCGRYGGALVAAVRERPEWGPTLRAAHLRDPDGNLVELQSY